jgi:tyrosyl-tRNA synthetase
MLSVEQIEANARTYQEQAFRVLDDDPGAAGAAAQQRVARHGKMDELLALVRTTTVGQLLERDDFAKRRARGEPVSVLELLYPLMQGYDSVAVRADIELGGTDQTFNLLLGRDIQRAYGQAGAGGADDAAARGYVDGRRRCRSRWATRSA